MYNTCYAPVFKVDPALIQTVWQHKAMVASTKDAFAVENSND